jgi:SAM-dependent methyltransferase
MDKHTEYIVEAAHELSARDGYAAWSSCYDDDGNPLIALEGPAVERFFGDIGGQAVLDVGCGTGRHTLALANRGAQVVALDQSPEMMAVARRKLAGRDVAWVRHALPYPLPFADGAFSLVVMGLVAEHVADLAAAMREMRRVTRLGGRCILSALHPDRTAQGQRARFIDPETGVRRPIATIHRGVAETRAIVEGAGWRFVAESTLVVPESLVETYPRAAKYAGMPLGWVGCWSSEI